MELLHVIVKSGPSPRPLAWSLEVSSSDSGEDWRLIRAFGDRDHCRKLWDLRPERRRRKARGVNRTSRAEKLTCSTQFASPRPLENGEVSDEHWLLLFHNVSRVCTKRDSRSYLSLVIKVKPIYIISVNRATRMKHIPWCSVKQAWLCCCPA